MTIHHNTLKKAEANGVTLTQIDPDHVEAAWPERNQRVTLADPKDALIAILAIKTIMREYPELAIRQDDRDWVITLKVGRKVTELARNEGCTSVDVLKETIGEGIDRWQGKDSPDDGEDDGDGAEDQDEADAELEEEIEAAGSIVKPKYRAEYKARGNPDHCSDWMAVALEPFVTTTIPSKSGKGKGKSRRNIDKTYAIARANGVDKQWPGLSNGQQSMNARNMMRPLVAKAAVLIIPREVSLTGRNVRLVPDADWIARHKPATTEE